MTMEMGWVIVSIGLFGLFTAVSIRLFLEAIDDHREMRLK